MPSAASFHCPPDRIHDVRTILPDTAEMDGDVGVVAICSWV